MTVQVNASPMYRLHHWAWIAADWVFPPTCAACGQAGYRLCPDCQRLFQPIDHAQACPKCDLPGYAHRPCPDCSKNPTILSGLRAYGIYEGMLREAIQAYKFKRDLGLGEIFVEFLASTLQASAWPVEVITAVPLGAKRARERGYNQAAYLAQLLAWRVKLPWAPQLTVRSRETQSQATLNADARLQNVKNAFIAGETTCRQQNVLLVDDIATTGATLNACAAALLENGAKNVYALTLARAAQIDQS